MFLSYRTVDESTRGDPRTADVDTPAWGTVVESTEATRIESIAILDLRYAFAPSHGLLDSLLLHVLLRDATSTRAWLGRSDRVCTTAP